MKEFNFNAGYKDCKISNGKATTTVKINTADANIRNRAKEAMENILKIQNEYANVNESTISTEELATILNKVESQIREQVNYIFDCDEISDAAFGNVSCLTATDGKILCIDFIERFVPFILEDGKKEYEKSEKNMQKYTDQVKLVK